jgi:hypothetical protein
MIHCAPSLPSPTARGVAEAAAVVEEVGAEAEEVAEVAEVAAATTVVEAAVVITVAAVEVPAAVAATAAQRPVVAVMGVAPAGTGEVLMLAARATAAGTGIVAGPTPRQPGTGHRRTGRAQRQPAQLPATLAWVLALR